MTYASAATGVFFLALTQHAVVPFTATQKATVILALLGYVATVAQRLIELHVDAKRFYAVAKQLEKPPELQNWTTSERYKAQRLRLIYGSYLTLAVATVCSVLFMVLRIL
jgi:hypothetical protein